MLWALVAGSATFWVLQSEGAGAATGTAAAPGQAPLGVAARADHPPVNLAPQVAMALGAKNPIAPTAASALAASQARLQLMGVLAVGSKNGAALIAVDGKPAKPYRVGAAIEEGLEVTSVAARSASIGSNGTAAFTLELPVRN